MQKKSTKKQKGRETEKRVSTVMCLFICLSTLFSFWLAFIVINIDTHVDIFSLSCRSQAQQSASCLIAMSNTQNMHTHTHTNPNRPTPNGNSRHSTEANSRMPVTLHRRQHKMKTYHCRLTNSFVSS